MARFATRDFLFPTGKLGELSVGRVGEVFELIFVAVFAGVAADVFVRLREVELRGLRGIVIADAGERDED